MVSGSHGCHFEFASRVEDLPKGADRCADAISAAAPLVGLIGQINSLSHVEGVGFNVHLIVVPVFIFVALVPLTLIVLLLFPEVDLLGDEG